MVSAQAEEDKEHDYIVWQKKKLNDSILRQGKIPF